MQIVLLAPGNKDDEGMVAVLKELQILKDPWQSQKNWNQAYDAFPIHNKPKQKNWDFPGGPMVKDSVLQMQGVGV